MTFPFSGPSLPLLPFSFLLTLELIDGRRTSPIEFRIFPDSGPSWRHCLNEVTEENLPLLHKPQPYE